MKRRSYLRSVGAVGVGTGIAGCLNTPSAGGDGGTSAQGYQDRLAESRTGGDRVTADSLAITVGDIATGSAYRLESNDTAEDPPTAGGQWLLCQLTVEQLDTVRRDFPLPGEAIELTYQEQTTASQVFPSDSVVMNGETYVPYDLILSQRQITSNGAFPGVEVTGWVVFEVPQEYDLSQILLGVSWGRGEDRGTAYWTFDDSHLR